MKKILIFVTLIIFSVLILSCSNDNDIDSGNNDNALSQTPQAISQFDNNNFGIYKGVFIGSSGIIVINLNNDGNVSATVIIDGSTYTFNTNDVVQENQQTTINFISGNNSFTFSVSSDGTNPMISNLMIEGHPNANILLVKETSVIVTKLFEGTYTGTGGNTDAGILNAIITSNEMYVLAYSTTFNVYFTAKGTINDDSTISGEASTGTTFTGTLENNDMKGVFSNSQSIEIGTWSGTRTF
ncbi:hypothetical protein [Tenacibaculum sp. M341]|uniref:hypothetical protein n=1 Tax=Tenacibaculum sp. M341 TaxID=2530339 RepID=UPI00104BA081|nr:hypothetical protein [Tenacibaculum sp. M341]TCI93044.1 hypothetical protein EYW44_05335 [Tenacibaculum sp. M341]